MNNHSNEQDDEVFTIKARKCLRCGRILTSQEAIENGYGCRCMELADAAKREKEPVPGQMDIFDFLGGSENGRSNDDGNNNQ
jgi:hypothetical protein